MTNEEKAKAYDEALERAKQYSAGHTLDVNPQSAMEYIFPELKESEDERVRKKLICFVENWKKYNPNSPFDDYIIYTNNSDECDKILAWLEKQGEQKQHLELKAGHWYFCHQAYCERADILTVKEGETFKCEKDGIVKGLIIKEPEKYFREISTPSDKVEPKFKVGDWIYHEKSDNTFHINEIENGLYVSDEGATISLGRQNDWRLWTIQDAKNGDVLTLNGEVFIYAHRKQLYSIAVAHCFVDSAGGFRFDGEFGYTERNNPIHPATKEQRDLLFSKMKEAGYEWDAEKKEFKKIEQNPTWSEEDEDKIREIRSALYDYYAEGNADELFYWLKSLKEKLKGGAE